MHLNQDAPPQEDKRDCGKRESREERQRAPLPHWLRPRSSLCCNWPYAGAGSPASARPSGRERRRDRGRGLSQRLLGRCVRKPAGGGGPALRVRPENWEEAGEKMPSESLCLAAQARLDSKWLNTDIQMIVSNKVEQRKKIWMSDREKKDEEETPAPVYSAKSILDSWVWGKQPVFPRRPLDTCFSTLQHVGPQQEFRSVHFMFPACEQRCGGAHQSGISSGPVFRLRLPVQGLAISELLQKSLDARGALPEASLFDESTVSSVWLEVVERATRFLRSLVTGLPMLSAILLLPKLWDSEAQETDNELSAAPGTSAPLLPLLQRFQSIIYRKDTPHSEGDMHLLSGPLSPNESFLRYVTLHKTANLPLICNKRRLLSWPI
ncbi:LOW QUALITY PROTEIN: E3 ubiquitin-protein ligase HERC2-like [Symphalangus syndactylus]|uniref:LOW QUALITY PROTEIN: E3 ubiquitin-protein ligase HERC2-like n=1 Tax=Symphalangus syndactylus TaxID=9590 RepID=UPI0030065BF2